MRWWFRRCRCTKCNDLTRQLMDAERVRDENWRLYQKAQLQRDEARRDADERLDALHKANNQRDVLQRRLNEIVDVAEGRTSEDAE